MQNYTTATRPPLDSLACVNTQCELYGQAGQENLIVRKVYGADQLRYLRCRRCRAEFSERNGSALWNSKKPEATAVAIAAQLSEGSSISATARLCGVDPSTVERLNRKLGEHSQAFHEAQAQALDIQTLQGDERHGFAGSKKQPLWEAELIDPASKFIVSHVQGPRNRTLIHELLADGARRVRDPQAILLLSDGESSYASGFPLCFGVPYRPPRQGATGRLPALRYRIPRTAAHAQLLKKREGGRVVRVEVVYTHGTRKRVEQGLAALGYQQINTSAIERRNGSARRMSSFQIRRSSAFAHRADSKINLGWWTMTVANWCRAHRALRRPLESPQGKKSTSRARRPWLWLSLITSSPSANFFSSLSILGYREIISPNYRQKQKAQLIVLLIA